MHRASTKVLAFVLPWLIATAVWGQNPWPQRDDARMRQRPAGAVEAPGMRYFQALENPKSELSSPRSGTSLRPAVQNPVQDTLRRVGKSENSQLEYGRANRDQRQIYAKDGSVISLPAVCTSDLPGYAFNNDQQSAVEKNPSAQSTVAPAPIADDQMRQLLKKIVEGSETPMPDALARQAAYYQNLTENRNGGPQARNAAAVNHSAYWEAESSTKQQGSEVALAGYNPHSKATAANKDSHKSQNLDPNCDPHQELFATSLFPSAVECAKCHQQIFDEWAGSSHAYAAVSPMFHKFEDTINRLSQGTLGYFCLRCHAPVATTVGLRRDQPIWDGPRVFREGVTCIACHHIREVNVKTNGERRIEPGTITDPVTGASDGSGVEATIKFKDHFKVKTDTEDKSVGQVMHKRVFQFEEISESTFCVSCHQVAVQPGIKLEVVWDQYRASPACKEGVSCQDCHMGKVPGANEGYSLGPAAVIDGRVVNPLRKHSNHLFYGPGYSIAHPGIFPHDPAQDRWTVNQWLEFDWRAGWGTDKFEDWIADNKIVYHFPKAWENIDDRYDARDIVNRNLKRLEYKKQVRRQLMENGAHVDGPFFKDSPALGQPLDFHYCVINKSTGHNMPSGSLGAQPQLWLNVVLIDPDGCRIWESGYLDSNGDLADLHSLDVLDRKIPLDKQLFNLQTKFLTTNVKGTDREMYLPVNFDFDQLPFLRPAAQPVTVLNHPPFIRMEGHSIPALGSREAKYRVPAGLLSKPGVYRLSVRMRSRAEPIYFMKFVGATDEMIQAMNEWIVDVHPYTVAFEVK